MSTVWDRAVAVLRMHIVSYVTIDGDAVCRCGWQHLERLHPTHLCHVLRADGLLRVDIDATETGWAAREAEANRNLDMMMDGLDSPADLEDHDDAEETHDRAPH